MVLIFGYPSSIEYLRKMFTLPLWKIMIIGKVNYRTYRRTVLVRGDGYEILCQEREIHRVREILEL